LLLKWKLIPYLLKLLKGWGEVTKVVLFLNVNDSKRGNWILISGTTIRRNNKIFKSYFSSQCYVHEMYSLETQSQICFHFKTQDDKNLLLWFSVTERRNLNWWSTMMMMISFSSGLFYIRLFPSDGWKDGNNNGRVLKSQTFSPKWEYCLH
jgi:hypothetical protein